MNHHRQSEEMKPVLADARPKEDADPSAEAPAPETPAEGEGMICPKRSYTYL